MSRIFVSVILSFLTAAAFPVEVHRCVSADGSVSFQQQACPGVGERIETGEVQAAWTSPRKEELRLYEQYRKRDRKRLEARRKAERRNARAARGVSDTTCYNKRHSLEQVQARLRAGYKPSQGDGLRRRRDYLEGYLRRFCS